MNILAIDTTSDILNTALMYNDQIYENSADIGLKHSETLAPMVDRLFQFLGAEYSNLDCIAVAKGPGSFTALRIGISFAKGIAFGASCPIISYNSLDLYAELKSYFPGIVVPIIDARKKRVYTAMYKGNKKFSDYLDISLEELLKKLETFSDSILFCGPHASSADLFAENKNVYYIDNIRTGAARLLLEKAQNSYNEANYDNEQEGPLYIRKSEAELGAKNA